MNDFSRRRLLEIGGAGTALSIAGCTSLSDDPTDEETDPEDDNGSGAGDASVDGEFTVTVAADIDDEEQAALQEDAQREQAEIQEQLEEGEIDQEEAQQRFQEIEADMQEAQLELITESVEVIESHVEEVPGLSLGDSVAESGLLLIGGEAEAIVELLALGEVGGLLAEEQFEDLQQPMP